jgi:hypothetical protein
MSASNKKQVHLRGRAKSTVTVRMTKQQAKDIAWLLGGLSVRNTRDIIEKVLPVRTTKRGGWLSTAYVPPKVALRVSHACGRLYMALQASKRDSNLVDEEVALNDFIPPCINVVMGRR